jgi:tetrahydromethanopterin S-methyltransferase subunit E
MALTWPSSGRWWWALRLLSGFLSGVCFQLSLWAETIADVQSANAVSILTSLIVIPLCIVALKMVRTIAQKQEELVRSSAASD